MLKHFSSICEAGHSWPKKSQAEVYRCVPDVEPPRALASHGHMGSDGAATVKRGDVGSHGSSERCLGPSKFVFLKEENG